MIKIGSRVRITTPSSDYYNLVGVVVKSYPSTQPNNDRFDVTFDQTELRKAARPEIVLKAKSTIYFMGRELELVENVPTTN